MKVHAPGKLILSGEHAVVYGQPALAMAVNRYVTAIATPQVEPHVSFDLSDLDYQRRLSLSSLNSLHERIKEKYQRFINGEFKIRHVLQKPAELAQFAFTLFFEALNIQLTQGVKICMQSNIPMGCGMGSSAATVLSIVHAIANHLEVELPDEMFLRLGQEAENMQHGYSSGLDLKVSLYGGCIYLENHITHARAIPRMPMFLINTGLPETSTGECIEAAASHFANATFADEFGVVTKALDMAFQYDQFNAALQAINANHELLVAIGVVPLIVQDFITEVQQFGGAAKICGAGAVAGQKAGVTLVMTEDTLALAALCERYHYSLLPIAGEPRGVHIL